MIVKLKSTRRFVSTALLGCSFKMESNIPNWTGKSSLLFILLHSIKTLIFPAKILAEDPEMSGLGRGQHQQYCRIQDKHKGRFGSRLFSLLGSTALANLRKKIIHQLLKRDRKSVPKANFDIWTTEVKKRKNSRKLLDPHNLHFFFSNGKEWNINQYYSAICYALLYGSPNAPMQFLIRFIECGNVVR